MADRLTKTRLAWQRFATEVIVERRRLGKKAWKSQFDRLRRDVVRYRDALDRIGAGSDETRVDPRELLVWAWCVLMAMPENSAQLYAAIREGPGENALGGLMTRLRRRGYAFEGLDTSPEMQIRWLASLVRAVDADLTGINYWEATDGRVRTDSWQVPGYPVFIIPVERPYRLEDGKERERRSTRYHALVPAALGDLAVDLILHPEVTRGSSRPPWIYGAATFPEMTIAIEDVGSDGFIVSAAAAPDSSATLEEQVREAVLGGCDVLLWPELTIDEERLAAIRRLLADDPLARQSRVPLIVPGSWHVREGDGWVNRSLLLASRGQCLGTYDKRRQFPFAGKREAIVPGQKLPIVVMQDRLVGLAICRDFCDDCAHDVYADLGVDLVLVPSMGEASSVKAHERSCKALQSQQGAVSFVVQQTPVLTGNSLPSGEARAYSFARPSAAKPLPAEQFTKFRHLSARR
jgi:predicted amidohydrolase